MHKGEVCAMFLSLHCVCVCGSGIILPNSTYREWLTSKERLLSDPENDFFQSDQES